MTVPAAAAQMTRGRAPRDGRAAAGEPGSGEGASERIKPEKVLFEAFANQGR